MKQTMMLTARGRAFLAVLTEDAMTIEADGTDSSTKAKSKELLRGWGLDDCCTTRLQTLYRAEDAQALLRSIKHKSLQAEQVKELFLLVQNVRRSSNKPLIGLVAEVLKETIVMVPEADERLVTYIHLPSEKDPNDSYFLSSPDTQADYVQNRLLQRLKTFLEKMLKNSKGGLPYVLILGDRLGLDADSLTPIHPILRALQQFMSNTIRVQAVLLQIGTKLVEFKKNTAWAAPEDQETLLKKYNSKKRVTVMLNDTLMHQAERKRFSTETGKKDVILPTDALTLPPQSEIDKARKYLEKLENLKQEKEREQLEKQPVGRRPALEAEPPDLGQRSANRFLKGEEAERVRVLIPTVLVPVVVGLTVGLILGANNIPAVSILPSALSAMGSIGFSVMIGASVGLVLAIVGFCVGWCCLNKKYRQYNLVGAASRKALVEGADDAGAANKPDGMSIRKRNKTQKKKKGGGARPLWVGPIDDYTDSSSAPAGKKRKGGSAEFFTI